MLGFKTLCCVSDIEIGHGGEARCGHHHGADASTLIIGAGLRYKSVLHMVRLQVISGMF